MAEEITLLRNGKRVDNREPHEIRPVKIEVGPLERADGSCYIEAGGNKIMAAVYGPREVHPRHLQKIDKALVRFRYNMAAFSVGDRKRPGPDRRSTELSKVGRCAVEPVIFTEYYPRTTIDIFVEVLEADAGTRTTGINAASVALADAGIPMRGLVSSCAVGKVDDTLIVDLCAEEDNFGQADLPIAIIPNTGEVTLLQMDGHLTLDEYKAGVKMAIDACHQMHAFQKEALINKYQGDVDNDG